MSATGATRPGRDVVTTLLDEKHVDDDTRSNVEALFREARRRRRRRWFLGCCAVVLGATIGLSAGLSLTAPDGAGRTTTPRTAPPGPALTGAAAPHGATNLDILSGSIQLRVRFDARGRYAFEGPRRARRGSADRSGAGGVRDRRCDGADWYVRVGLERSADRPVLLAVTGRFLSGAGERPRRHLAHRPRRPRGRGPGVRRPRPRRGTAGDDSCRHARRGRGRDDPGAPGTST